MFSGIVEAVVPVVSSQADQNAARIYLQKPSDFNDLKIGDSIAVNGICLTLEFQDENRLQFALGAETLKIIGLNLNSVDSLSGQLMNLERSLRMGDRIHGHLVTGHVQTRAKVLSRSDELGSCLLKIEMSPMIAPYVWSKGSIAVNGVSLTVNEVDDQNFSVCLIPETLKRTNLGQLKSGSMINLEPDYIAKAMVRRIELKGESHA